jgi:hypothetical protein
MIEAIAREMLDLPKARPKLFVVSEESVKAATPERQKSVMLRPLERRRLQAAAGK